MRRCLDALGVEYVIDPRLVRGLDYYVRTTFEVLTRDLGAQNAVAGGGRYDGLIQQLDGPADPGIGFALGLERVVLLLGREEERRELLALMIPVGEAGLARLLPVARALRQRGLPVEIGYGARRLQRELERANRLGARYAVIAGDTELAAGEAIVRDLKSRDQRAIPLGALEVELAKLAQIEIAR